MSEVQSPLAVNAHPAPGADLLPAASWHLRVTFDLVAGGIRFDRLPDDSQEPTSSGWLMPAPVFEFQYWVLDRVSAKQKPHSRDGCTGHASSLAAVRASGH